MAYRRCTATGTEIRTASRPAPAVQTAALATANPVRRRSCHGVVDDAWPWLVGGRQGEHMPRPSPSVKA